MRLRITFAAALAGSLYAQTPAKPDSPQVTEHLDKARALAGRQWAELAYQFFCVDPHANSNDDPPIEPSKLFDNVYAIGNTGTVAYAITTLRMASSCWTLWPRIRSTSVSASRNAQVGARSSQGEVLIVVAHGHADHFGGSAYFFQNQGRRT